MNAPLAPVGQDGSDEVVTRRNDDREWFWMTVLTIIVLLFGLSTPFWVMHL